MGHVSQLGGFPAAQNFRNTILWGKKGLKRWLISRESGTLLSITCTCSQLQYGNTKIAGDNFI